MNAAPNHPEEIARLNSLEEHKLLDTLPEEVYDDITQLASEIVGTPVALLNLIEEKRQWTKSQYGIEIGEVPRDNSFCAHTILNLDEPLVVTDTRYDERFHDNPMTLGDPAVIFYAGVPVRDADGLPLGSLCVVDHRPREIAESKILALQALAKLVDVHFELRKIKIQHEELQQKQEQAKQIVKSVTPHLNGLLADSNLQHHEHIHSIIGALNSLQALLQKQ